MLASLVDQVSRVRETETKDGNGTRWTAFPQGDTKKIEKFTSVTRSAVETSMWKVRPANFLGLA